MTNSSSPHVQDFMTSARLMRLVIIACIPATVVLFMLFGHGVFINLLLCIVTSIVVESIIAKLRYRSIRALLADYTGVLTAVLIALAIPPLAPWWIPVTGTLFAILVAKQLFGGVGMNPFNPAMIAYVVLLISFPLQMSAWVAPNQIVTLMPIDSQFDAIFNNVPIDAYTMATPLDSVRHLNGQTVNELYDSDPLLSAGKIAGYSSEMINFAFLLGGLYLLKRRVFSWHAPAGMLLSLTLISFLFWGGDGSEGNGSPIFHLLSGATMMGAFFIITDPVSGATSQRGRFIFGCIVGVVTYLIRVWGNYPDGVAFAVLLANICAPFIDYYTVPRSYGYESSESVIKREEEK